MRLFHVKRLIFEDFSNRKPEPYVIASHRWLSGEITYQDVRDRKKRNTQGYKKVLEFTKYVKTHSTIRWLWIDTCCIDKTNSVELDTAINSMFSWYRDAALCLVYLHDVPSPYVESSFRHSDWFTRGWTLQELLAPTTVVFLSRSWQPLGHKHGRNTGAPALLTLGPRLNSVLSDCTGVSQSVLEDFSQSHDLSVDEKFAWLEARSTTKPEDLSYCMIGIFDVDMTIRYGGNDGGRDARRRLEAKLAKKVQQAARSARAFESHDRDLLDCLEYLERLGLREAHHQRRQLTGHQPAGPPAALLEASNDQLLPMAAWHRQLTSLQQSQAHAQEARTVGGVGMVDDCITPAPSTAVMSLSRPGDPSYGTSPARVEDHNPGYMASRTAQARPSKRQAGTRALRIKLGWQLLSKWSYEIIITRTMFGWNAAIHSQATVPNNSPIMLLCHQGDIQGMQDLVSAGQASWYDRDVDGYTLLDLAVNHHQTDLCEYLLANVQWPEHELVVHQALLYAYNYSDKPRERLLGILFGQHELQFDVDLETELSAGAVLRLLSSSARWFSIASNMLIPWYTLPLSQRFELLFDTIDITSYVWTVKDPIAFHESMGIEGDAKDWLTLRKEDGENALHLAAAMLCVFLQQGRAGPYMTSLQRAWVEWGSSLLRAGLDPHSVARNGIACQFLLEGLLQARPYDYDLLLCGLHAWLEMIQDAGIDPDLYVERENEIWQTLPWTWEHGSHRIDLLEVIAPDEGSQEWSLVVVEGALVTLYKRDICPASFPPARESIVPLTICWKPDQLEEDEGIWIRGRSIDLWSEAFEIREQFNHGLIMGQLIEMAQDDAGMVARLVDAFAKKKPARARHRSAPPPIHRRHREYCRKLLSLAHPWMPEFHLCPTDSRLKICGDHGYASALPWYEMDLRYCLKAESDDCRSVCSTGRWGRRSFLAEIAFCQHFGASFVDERNNKHDCAQGCKDVRLKLLCTPPDCQIHRLEHLPPRLTAEATAHCFPASRVGHQRWWLYVEAQEAENSRL